MKKWLSILIGVLLVSSMAVSSQACVWGSFDESRINYPGGTLNGSAHTQLRAIIAAHGGTVAPGTPTLTDDYLATVDVFYTSLLSTSTGALSGAEQTALHTWIANGGTLIVTADIFPLDAYESFTAYYGVTGYSQIGDVGVGSVVANHPITQGVGSFFYNTNATYNYGSDALLLGDDQNGRTFMIVMEPGTGFNAGGRILVFGDHNMFTDSYIGSNDNTILANNFAEWACAAPPPVPVQNSTWGHVKSLFK